jgi:hypothetical protein
MRFDRSLVSDLDEPVQRFFTHAIRDGAALGRGAALESVVFAPSSVLPDRGVTWWADGADSIVGRFELTIPSSLPVGWWFDTPRYAPFFEARVEDSTQY